MARAKKKTIEELKAEARKISVKEGSGFGIMEGFGLRYITPYALALGAGNSQIGILHSFAALFGSLSQLFTNSLMKRHSRRKIVFWGVLLQALMWLPLIVVGALYFFFNLSSNYAVWSLIVSYIILILFSSIATPAWSSWMKDIVPARRGEYFGKRTRRVGIIALCCTLLAGIILDSFKASGVFFAFAIIFFLAFIGRSISAYYYTKQYEPRYKNNEKAYFGFLDFVRTMTKNNFGRFVLFTSLISFSTAIASPFFAVYMLKDLGLSYLNYTIIIVAHTLVLFAFMPVWGKFSDKFGNIKTLKLNGLLIGFVPLIWFLSFFILKSYPNFLVLYLVLIEIFSGFVWAGFTLSLGNFIYDSVTKEKIALCASYFNIINSFGTFVGALLGGFLASTQGLIMGFSAILMIFILSGTLRILFALWFGLSVHEVREVQALDLDGEIKEIDKMTFGALWKYMTLRFIRPH